MSYTATVTLPPEVQEQIRVKIDSGRYAYESEVIRAALRALDDQEKLQQLRHALMVGTEQIHAGQEVEFTPALLEEIDAAATSGSLAMRAAIAPPPAQPTAAA